MTTNHRPRVRGTDDAVWRRLRLLPFDRQFRPEEQDHDLIGKLQEELPGVLAWCVEGCREWQKSGLDAPDIVMSRTAEYRVREDIVGTFVADCCVEGDGFEVGATKLYQRSRKWYEANGERPASQTQLGSKMSERGFKGHRTRAEIVRIGISVQETDFA